jgi:phospholipid/cholesterol/gamma-HCH transport system substrate-binding protein
MARRNIAEVAAGAVVLVIAAGFLVFAVAHTGRSSGSGYTLHASFDRIDGLPVGADVRLAGVKVGNVTAEGLDPKTYMAKVSFTVANDVKLPTDTSAEIISESLLGGDYLSLVPGGSEQEIPPGGTVTITQSSINIEQLLGNFIFSAANLANAAKSGGTGSAGRPPGAAPGSAPPDKSAAPPSGGGVPPPK